MRTETLLGLALAAGAIALVFRPGGALAAPAAPSAADKYRQLFATLPTEPTWQARRALREAEGLSLSEGALKGASAGAIGGPYGAAGGAAAGAIASFFM